MISDRLLEAKSNLIGLMEGLLTLEKRLKHGGLLSKLIEEEIDDIWENNGYRTIIKEEEEKSELAKINIKKTEGVTNNG